MKLSVIIITKNEADNIQACLDSVKFANEWIIVDSGSTDSTVWLAKTAGATIIETDDWPGFGPQKNRALDAATGEWILSLDADERIPDGLRDEIIAAMNGILNDRTARSIVIKRTNGRVFDASLAPKPGGGFVVTDSSPVPSKARLKSSGPRPAQGPMGHTETLRLRLL